MTALPPFPVDPGTLNVLDATIRDGEGDHLDRLLTLLAGHDDAGEETIHDGALHVDTGPLYSREDVILALIEEVRVLRESVARWSRSWAAAAEALAPDWPKEPA